MCARNIALVATIFLLQVWSSYACKNISYQNCLDNFDHSLAVYKTYYALSNKHFHDLRKEIDNETNSQIEHMNRINDDCYKNVTAGLNYYDALMALCRHCPIDHKKYEIHELGLSAENICLKIVMNYAVLCEEEHEEKEHDHKHAGNGHVHGDNYIHDCDIKEFFNQTVYQAWSNCNSG